MKKQRFLIVTWLLLLSICFSLAGCAGESSFDAPSTTLAPQGNHQESAPVEQAPANQPTEIASAQATASQPEKTESAQVPNQQDETGKYRHEIDGIVFYTEHDVEQWITRIEGGRRVFDLDRMVKDIFGEDAMGGNGYAFFYGGQHFHILNTNLNGSTNSYPREGYYPCINVDTISIYDMGHGAGDEYYLPVYFFSEDSNKTDGTEYEMLEIALYACEMWANDETHYYSFENFEASQRFMVVHR